MLHMSNKKDCCQIHKIIQTKKFSSRSNVLVCMTTFESYMVFRRSQMMIEIETDQILHRLFGLQ